MPRRIRTAWNRPLKESQATRKWQKANRELPSRSKSFKKKRPFSLIITSRPPARLNPKKKNPRHARALRQLGVPSLFVSQLQFLYRYIFVLMEETMRMVRARNMRSFGGRGKGIRVFVRIAGILFLRTLEPAERIYDAMLSRGFQGDMPTLKRFHIKSSDLVFAFITGFFLGLPILSRFRNTGPDGLWSVVMSHHIVEFKNVSFSYPDKTEALRDVSFRITHGASVGIIGANGAGKSTLLMHLNGYLMPTSETINIGDLYLTRQTRRKPAKKSASFSRIPTIGFSCRRSMKTSLSGRLIRGLIKRWCAKGWNMRSIWFIVLTCKTNHRIISLPARKAPWRLQR